MAIQMTDKKENRGGARAGAGRPPGSIAKEYSDEFKDKLLEALDRKAEETGQTVYELFVDRLYNKRVQDAVFASMFKIVADVSQVKAGTINDNRTINVIALPPVKEPVQPSAIEAEVVEKEDNGSSRS